MKHLNYKKDFTFETALILLYFTVSFWSILTDPLIIGKMTGIKNDEMRKCIDYVTISTPELNLFLGLPELGLIFL